MSTRTMTYAIVTPYELYRCVLGARFKVFNSDLTAERGVMLKLSNGVFEDDLVVMEYVNES